PAPRRSLSYLLHSTNTLPPPTFSLFFFSNATSTTAIYTLSLHDALPIYRGDRRRHDRVSQRAPPCQLGGAVSRKQRERRQAPTRSEEHTSELQSLAYLVCRLLLEKKKKRHAVRGLACVISSDRLCCSLCS